MARKTHVALDQSTPKELHPGQWHIPFGDMLPEMDSIKIATARCARVSYLNFDGTEDYSKDIQLHDNLLKMKHLYPFEHIAKASDKYISSGNFRGGWEQYRHMVS